MPLNLSYFSHTKPDALAAALTNTATLVQLADGSSFPDPAAGGNSRYTIVLAYGTSREEICTVTAKPTPTTLTVLRGQDGTAATAKNSGDVVVHGVSARDFREMAEAFPKSGGTMTGPLILSGPPTTDLQAASKKYVDDAAGAALTTALANSVPIGTIVAYGGTSAPSGWHLCDGSTHGSGALQTVLGSTRTPDLRGQFIVAANYSGGDAPAIGGRASYARGNVGGADSVTLSEAQSGLRTHNHGAYSDAETQEHTHSGTTDTMDSNWAHGHGVSAWTNGGGDHVHLFYGSQNLLNMDAAGSGYNVPSHTADWLTGGAHDHTVGVSLSDTDINHRHGFTTGGRSAAHSHGVGVHNVAGANAAAPHENRPPYYALTYIIRKG